MDFAHTSMLVNEFLAKNKNLIISQPPYPQDLATLGREQIPKLKISMKGKGFAMIQEIKENLKQKLLAIPTSAFQKCFEDGKQTLA